MRIGELSRRSGLPHSRLRFYEAAGLLAAVERRANGYREYPPQAVQILKIITSAQKSGFSLDEIRPLLPQNGGVTWKREELLASLQQKLKEIEQLQKRLAQNRRHLKTAIDAVLHKPESLQCADNLGLVLAKIR